MSLTALSNSTLAMLAQSTSLSTISQNIANVNTTGYKSSETMFATVLTKTSATADIFGVSWDNRNNITTQGTVNSTGTWSDLAINGDGFFVVNTQMDGSGETLFTRDGSWELQAVDSDGDGAEDLAYLVDSNGYYLQGYAADANGNVDTSTMSSVYYTAATTLAGQSTTSAAIYGVLDATATTEQSMSMGIYGPESADDGTTDVGSTALELLWTPGGTSNEWDLTFSIEGATISNPTTAVSFNGSGAMTSSGTVTLDVTWADGTTSQVGVDISNILQLSDFTTVDHTTQDGYDSGSLTDISFDSSGNLVSSYDNGRSIVGFQVPVADFVAANSLEQRTGNLYAQTQDSGDYTLVTAGTQGVSFVAGALENSTVDIETQFTKMIMTQTAYTSASKVFTVADEMIQEVTNMKS